MLFFLLRCWRVFLLLLLGLSALPAIAAPAERSAQLEHNLTELSQWLSASWQKQYPADHFLIQLLPIADPDYRMFIRSRVAEQHQATVGDPALSAFFEPAAFANGTPTPICYLLYNPNKASDLDQQFFYDGSSRAQTLSTLFLVAHETAHCLDLAYPFHPRPAQPEIADRWGETGADFFATLLALQLGYTATELQQVIAARRYAGDAAHSTWPALQKLLKNTKNENLTSNLKDLWKTADRLRVDYFE